MQSSAQRLLLVEDDVTVARALRRTLLQRGLAVVVAPSCSAARALGERFDIAILDLDLPDGNGVELAQQLLDDGKVPSVLFFTGSSDGALLARARRLGPLVLKSSGASSLLAILTLRASEPPHSCTTASPNPRSQRASPSTTARRSRAR